ncbi:MAG: DUF2063 domain-containing protein [Thioalkalivibrionaceae bacterium]
MNAKDEPDDAVHARFDALAAYLRDPDHAPPPPGLEARRLAIYRRLFRNNVRGLLVGAFPVTHRVLGDARFADLVEQFRSSHASHTPYFHRIGREFLDWAVAWLSTTEGQSWPPFLAELLHYERAELEVAFDPVSTPPPYDADGDPWREPVVLSPSLTLLAYEFPVQRISADFQPQAPDPVPTYLMLFRAADDKVRFQALTPLAAALLWELKQAPGALATVLPAVLGALGLVERCESLTDEPVIRVMDQASNDGALIGSSLVAEAVALVQKWRKEGAVLGTLAHATPDNESA